jgi:hypothetical protein
MHTSTVNELDLTNKQDWTSLVFSWLKIMNPKLASTSLQVFLWTLGQLKISWSTRSQSLLDSKVFNSIFDSLATFQPTKHGYPGKCQQNARCEMYIAPKENP